MYHSIGSRTRIREFFCKVGREISDNIKAVAIEVAAHRNDVRASYADPKSDLHNERDRVRQ